MLDKNFYLFCDLNRNFLDTNGSYTKQILNIINRHSSFQLVKKSTRNDRLLDPFITNDNRAQIFDVLSPGFSDHNFIH